VTDPLFTADQLTERERFSEFAKNAILPHAFEIDRSDILLPEITRSLAQAELFGRLLLNGRDRRNGLITYGLLHEELGRICCSARSLVTVQDIVLTVLCRWGSSEQRSIWVDSLLRGETIAAFAMSEVNAGSDPFAIETTAVTCASGYRLSGRKMWVSFGEIAGLFLVIARLNGQPTAFLLDGRIPGLSRAPIRGLLGARGSMLAEIIMEDCKVSSDSLIGGAGCAMLTVVPTALWVGRYAIAWGCVGMAQACLEESVNHACARLQFGTLLRDRQLVQRLIANMHTRTSAARLLSWEAGMRLAAKSSNEGLALASAKYFASKVALKSASTAVRLQGAAGCTAESLAGRHFRDAKIMEIIEGSNEIQQVAIAEELFALDAEAY
jgi:alkylation response protein AidB-like acyl-CoA dehydrogenase